MWDTEVEPELWEPCTLEIGMTVRIDAHGECKVPFDVTDLDIGETYSGRKIGHPRVFHNVLGVVVSIDRSEIQKGHYYRVAYSKAVWYKNDSFIAGDYAAIELEKVSHTVNYANLIEVCTFLGMDNEQIRAVVQETKKHNN